MIGVMVPNVYAEISITDDSTGGDCTTIGTWNSASKTCTLRNDINKYIVIQSDGIIFDGNSKSISLGDDVDIMREEYFKNYNDAHNDGVFENEDLFYSMHAGISINGFNDIVIKNINLNFVHHGIYVKNSKNIIIQNNQFSNIPFNGLILENSSNNEISNNNFQNMDVAIGIHKVGSYDNIIKQNKIKLEPENGYAGGITICEYAHNNKVFDNIIDDTSTALSICSYATENDFFQNTITNSMYTVTGDGSYNSKLKWENKFYNNNFYDFGDISVPLEIWNLELPVGGNYWGLYDEPEEGCMDDNYDNICDSPLFSSAYRQNGDLNPWNLPNIWNTEIKN